MRILVVGAGPAGLASSQSAAAKGHEVMIFEKNGKLGEKACGEALGKEALGWVGLEPSRRFVKNDTKGFRMSFKGRFMKEASFADIPTCPRYVVDKPALLETVLEKACELGAKVRFNARVTYVDPAKGKIKMGDGTTEQGDLVVCADGLGSVARSHLDYSNYGIAMGLQYCCPLPKDIDEDYLYLDIIGEGYAWIFPKGGSANIGVGLPNSSGKVKELKGYLDRHIEKLGVEPMGKMMAAPVPIGGPLKSFSREKMVAAGDAAGCVMPLSGEGIRFAFFGGSIAHLPGYRDDFMAQYGNNMHNSKKMLKIIEGLNDEDRFSLLGKLDDPMATLEGKLPKVTPFLNKPQLLLKMAKLYLT